MTDARQHHVVPKCYLKGFTHNGSKNSKLFVVDIPSARSFISSPRNVAKRRDFNRIEGLPPGALENKLSKFEGEVSKALEVIAAARTLEDDEAWLYVVNLMALLAVRNPRWRENFRQFQERICKVVLDLALATPERWAGQVRQMQEAGAWKESKVTYEQMKKFHDEDQYKIVTPTAMHIDLEFGVLDKVIPLLLARRWLLLVAPSGGGFITSDHPVCLMPSEGGEASFRRPVGFALNNTTVIFALTKDLMAIGTFEGTGGAREVTPFQVGYFNSIIASFAERQVYSADDRFPFVGDTAPRLIRGADLPRFLQARRSSQPAAVDS